MSIQYNTIKCPNCFSVASGKVSVISEIESINNCIGLLLRSSRGELVGDPMFGTNLMKMMYEPNDYILQDSVRSEIVTAINKYENRVYVTESDIDVSSDDNVVDVSISYYVKKTGEIGVFQFSLLREDYNNG